MTTTVCGNPVALTCLHASCMCMLCPKGRPCVFRVWTERWCDRGGSQQTGSADVKRETLLGRCVPPGLWHEAPCQLQCHTQSTAFKPTVSSQLLTTFGRSCDRGCSQHPAWLTTAAGADYSRRCSGTCQPPIDSTTGRARRGNSGTGTTAVHQMVYTTCTPRTCQSPAFRVR